MIKVNSKIIEQLKQPSNIKYFLPEIEEFYAGHPLKFKGENQNRYENYEKNRKLGENIDIVAEMIRNDSVQEFISYINRNNFSIKNKILESPFETNLFLTERRPTLIEYAAFFGSIQIFNYLRMNNVELESSLWLYMIHSNNPEMIHLLESNQVFPEDKKYDKCIIESIKCHHNNIAKYFLNNNNNENKRIFFDSCFQYCNYELIPTDPDSYSKYYFSVESTYEFLLQYPEFVNLLFESEYININMKIVLEL